MTKTKAKRSITKASTSKTSATKSSSPTSDDICLLVLGFDEQQKPVALGLSARNAEWTKGPIHRRSRGHGDLPERPHRGRMNRKTELGSD